ncbi:MAG: hypothetical protein ABFD50_19075 [Smithella sp.]
MNITSKGMAIELLNRALPYPEQMKDIDLNQKDAVYFTWRGERFKLEFYACAVWKSSGCIIEGTPATLLMERLIKRELISMLSQQ